MRPPERHVRLHGRKYLTQITLDSSNWNHTIRLLASSTHWQGTDRRRWLDAFSMEAPARRGVA
jgi:hypothetical protein